jgi:hypothetical protein
MAYQAKPKQLFWVQILKAPYLEHLYILNIPLRIINIQLSIK